MNVSRKPKSTSNHNPQTVTILSKLREPCKHNILFKPLDVLLKQWPTTHKQHTSPTLSTNVWIKTDILLRLPQSHHNLQQCKPQYNCSDAGSKVRICNRCGHAPRAHLQGTGNTLFFVSGDAYFFWTGARTCGRRACVFGGPCGDDSMDLDQFMCLAWFFWTTQLFVFETGFCFSDSYTCFVDSASIGVEGNLLLHALILGVFFFDFGTFSWRVHFFGRGKGRVNWDIATTCMQEVLDSGENRILKWNEYKKWWTGQRG